MLVLESFPLGGGAFQPSQHSKIQSLIFLNGNSLKHNWDDVQFQVKWTARGRRWYWRWMPKWWTHSKRESTLRRTRWMASVTSFTRVAMSSKRAGTNVNTRAGYSSETSKTWQAGEVARTEAPAWWTCVFQVAPRASISPSHRIVRCTKHNWKLNASTMKYVNPPDSFSQDELGEFCLQPQLQSIEKQCSLFAMFSGAWQQGSSLGVVFKRGGPPECSTQTLPPPYLPPKNDRWKSQQRLLNVFISKSHIYHNKK